MSVFPSLFFSFRLSLTLLVVKVAPKDLLAYAISFFVIIFGFGIAAFMIYGDTMQEFNKTLQSSFMMVRMMLGSIDYERMSLVEPVITPIFVFVFLVVFYVIFLKTFIIVLDTHLEETLAHMKNIDTKFASFIMRRLLAFVKHTDREQAELLKSSNKQRKERRGFIAKLRKIVTAVKLAARNLVWRLFSPIFISKEVEYQSLPLSIGKKMKVVEPNKYRYLLDLGVNSTNIEAERFKYTQYLKTMLDLNQCGRIFEEETEFQPTTYNYWAEEFKSYINASAAKKLMNKGSEDNFGISKEQPLFFSFDQTHRAIHSIKTLSEQDIGDPHIIAIRLAENIINSFEKERPRVVKGVSTPKEKEKSTQYYTLSSIMKSKGKIPEHPSKKGASSSIQGLFRPKTEKPKVSMADNFNSLVQNETGDAPLGKKNIASKGQSEIVIQEPGFLNPQRIHGEKHDADSRLHSFKPSNLKEEVRDNEPPDSNRSLQHINGETSTNNARLLMSPFVSGTKPSMKSGIIKLNSPKNVANVNSAESKDACEISQAELPNLKEILFASELLIFHSMVTTIRRQRSIPQSQPKSPRPHFHVSDQDEYAGLREITIVDGMTLVKSIDLNPLLTFFNKIGETSKLQFWLDSAASEVGDVPIMIIITLFQAFGYTYAHKEHGYFIFEGLPDLIVYLSRLVKDQHYNLLDDRRFECKKLSDEQESASPYKDSSFRSPTTPLYNCCFKDLDKYDRNEMAGLGQQFCFDIVGRDTFKKLSKSETSQGRFEVIKNHCLLKRCEHFVLWFSLPFATSVKLCIYADDLLSNFLAQVASCEFLFGNFTKFNKLQREINSIISRDIDDLVSMNAQNRAIQVRLGKGFGMLHEDKVNERLKNNIQGYKEYLVQLLDELETVAREHEQQFVGIIRENKIDLNMIMKKLNIRQQLEPYSEPADKNKVLSSILELVNTNTGQKDRIDERLRRRSGRLSSKILRIAGQKFAFINQSPSAIEQMGDSSESDLSMDKGEAEEDLEAVLGLPDMSPVKKRKYGNVSTGGSATYIARESVLHEVIRSLESKMRKQRQASVNARLNDRLGRTRQTSSIKPRSAVKLQEPILEAMQEDKEENSHPGIDHFEIKLKMLPKQSDIHPEES